MEKYLPGEMILEEYSAIFDRMGFEPFNITFTGGEPFFREDFFDIVSAACRTLNPVTVNIRTCADLPKQIAETMKKLSVMFPEIYFVTWLSMDGIGKDLSYLRGNIPGTFEYILETFSFLNSMGAPNHRTGISILISTYNAEKASSLISTIFNMYPDFVSLGYACGSEGLASEESKVSPNIEDSEKALRSYEENIKTMKGGPVERAIHSVLLSNARTQFGAISGRSRFRNCTGGFQSLYIDPHGTVKTCPHKNLPLGELSKCEMSIKKVISSQNAAIARKQVKGQKCACPSDCAMFSNIILSPRKFASAAAAIM